RAVFLVGHDAAMGRISAGGNGRAVDFGGAREHRMMISKKNALSSQLMKRGRVLLRDEVGPHSVPDDHHDVLRLTGAQGGGGEESVEENAKDNRPHWTLSLQTISSTVKR